MYADSPEHASGSFYHGSISTEVSRTLSGRIPEGGGPAGTLLDAGRSASAGLRSTAVWAAGSVVDATAIASIRAWLPRQPVPYETIRVYRVEIAPFHLGPVAIIDELQERLKQQPGGSLDSLVREYWAPTGVWHLTEFLASSLSIVQEVRATSERDTYIRRWVHYNQDRRRAETL